MSLQKRKLTSCVTSVSSLDDKQKMTAKDLKAAFDSNSNELQLAINRIIDDLTRDDGANQIGFKTTDDIYSNNIQNKIVYINDKISKVDPYLSNPVSIS